MKKIQDEYLDAPPQINIVPTIDVIFAILAFFIMASLFLTRSEGLPVNLPEAATAQNPSVIQISITIDATGNISLNRRAITLNELTTQVRELLKTNRQALVAIEADEKVEHGRVIEVIDRLRTIENLNVSIATQQQ